MIIIDSLNRIINENDIISYKNNITIKKSDSGIPFGNYTFMFACVVSEPKNYSELVKYSDDIRSFTSDCNNISYSSIYEPVTLTGKIAYFNFSISSCYKTCSDCNNRLGNYNKHFCSNCSDDYPKMYLNGEKCVSSCDEINLYEYNNDCLNKVNGSTFTDDKTNINSFIDNKSNDNTFIENKSNDNTFIDNKSNDNIFIDNKSNDNTFIENKSNDNTFIDNKTNINSFIDNKSNDNTFIENKSNDNTFIEELTYVCYDNCTDNKNITNIKTYQNLVDICPEEYIYKYEYNEICYLEKINKFVHTCRITECLKGLCIVNNDKDNDNNPEEKDIMISNIRKLIKDSIIPEIFDEENKGIIIKYTDTIYQIIPAINQKNSIKDNISTIW